MVIFQIYMLIAILFLAGKDSTNFRLKEKHIEDKDLEDKRIDRNHRDGVALNILILLPWIYFNPERGLEYIIYTILLRLVFYDIAFNYWGGLDYKFLGSTAWWDIQFIKIFGKYGAIKKSITFISILLLINILTWLI